MGDVPAGQELEAVGDVAAPDDQLVDVKGRTHTRAKLHEGRYWDEKFKLKKQEGAVAEWSEVMYLIGKNESKPKIQGLIPGPVQPSKYFRKGPHKNLVTSSQKLSDLL